MSDDCSLALKINVTFCERVEDEGEGNTFRRLSWGSRVQKVARTGESGAIPCVLTDSYHSFETDAVKGLSGERCSGISVFEGSFVLGIPNPLFSEAEQDEMLPHEEPTAEFPPVVVLLASAELHRGKPCPWCVDVAKGLLPRPVEAWIMQRAACCTWLLIAEETNIVSVSLNAVAQCGLGNGMRSPAGMVLSTQDVLGVGDVCVAVEGKGQVEQVTWRVPAGPPALLMGALTTGNKNRGFKKIDTILIRKAGLSCTSSKTPAFCVRGNGFGQIWKHLTALRLFLTVSVCVYR